MGNAKHSSLLGCQISQDFKKFYYRTPLKGKALSLTHKYQTRVEVTDTDKHCSSLLWFGVNYGHKKVYCMCPGRLMMYRNVCTMTSEWYNHRLLRNIDCLSFVMCPLLVPVLIVNRLLFFSFFFCCSHLQNYWSKQGRQNAPLSSLYYLDVYGYN